MLAQPAPDRRPVVIGAGPAGLTAAYELATLALRPVVVEKTATVGGLARTETYRGFHFDVGGHRFFTKAAPVERLWQEVLGPHLLRRPRLSRIYYDGRFFAYPLRPLNALAGLGVREAALVVLSHLRWRLFPSRLEETFEQWVTNRFGRRLFRTFFRTYTEKVWGVPCSELRAEWAAQRIKDLSLGAAILGMFVRPRRVIRTLIEEFQYPRLGPGMMWNRFREEVARRGGSVRLDAEVVRITRDGRHVTAVVVGGPDGREDTITGTDFISSMPVTEVIARLEPPPDAEVRRAAGALRYRAFVTVCLIVDRADLFPDNWIYVHDPHVRVGRIQNFKNWSADMVPDPAKTSLGLEYFCDEGDALWSMSDAELVALATREVAAIGLARPEEVEDGTVLRMPKAYPIYDAAYADYLTTVRRFMDGLENFQTIGRNGLHRYDNQDHAMLTGMLAVRNLVHGERHDLWAVNTDAAYHEEETGVVEEALATMFGKLDRVAFGGALGLVAGIAIGLATLFLVAKGGTPIGPHLALLAQYFPGYEVTLAGALLGFAYGVLAGFVGGWTFAVVRNAATAVYLAVVRRRAEIRLLDHFLEYV